MNQRDLKNFRNVNEMLDRELEEELGLVYSDDMSEDLKNK